MPYPAFFQGRLNVLARRSWFARSVIGRFNNFFLIQETAGFPMIIAALGAIIWANIDHNNYTAFWETHVSLDAELFRIDEPLKEWINIFLLPLFFLVIGIEIKYETTRGGLSTWQKASLPLAMAVGGIAVPAGCYLLVNAIGGGKMHGWGVPVATDIAFALGVLSLIGRRIPSKVRLLLLSFAAADDIGGVLIIAFFYTQQMNFWALGGAVAIVLVIAFLSSLGMRQPAVYTLLGAATIVATHFSGVHPTIAGIVLGLMVRAKPILSYDQFRERAGELLDNFHKNIEQEGLKSGRSPGEDNQKKENNSEEFRDRQENVLGEFDELATHTFSSAHDLIHRINPWASYIVLPLFALSHAGVQLGGEQWQAAATSMPALGVAAGLLIGKPVGIVVITWIALRLGICRLPEGVTWPHLIGLGLLAGIGFTVAIFIASLAFQSQELAPVKLAILLCSVVAALAGLACLAWASRNSAS